MKNVDKKLPTDTEKLKQIAEKTDNPQMKRDIEKRVNTIEHNKTVYK